MLNGGLESSEGGVSRQMRGRYVYGDREKGGRRNVGPHGIEAKSTSLKI